jgi:deazaflavin-dependent oxidoreductase (nitroreductase family)
VRRADGERIVVIGTNFGQRQNPAWYYNLRADPAAGIAYHGRSAAYTGRPATEEEREHFWREGAKVYVGYAAYLSRVVGREVPIFVLTPQGE